MKNWTIDRVIIWSVTLAVLGEVALNYITSYQHIYVLGLKFGEYGTDARLMPLAIDLMLLAFALVNLYLSRKDRKSFWMRAGLALGVTGTVAANVAYGAFWGHTGALLAGWPAVALFATVEAGMFLLRVAAEEAEKAAKAVKNTERAVKAATTRRGRHAPGTLADAQEFRDVVAGPDIPTMERILGNLPDRASPRPFPPEPEGKETAPPMTAGLQGIGLRNGG